MNFSGATAGFAAGAQANDSLLDYTMEAEYGVTPTGAVFMPLRITSETLKLAHSTSRPDEINANGVASDAVLTQVQVSGDVSGYLSAVTFDNIFTAVMTCEYSSDVAFTNAAVRKSFTIRKKIGGNFHHYTGCIVSQLQIQMSDGGQPPSFSFTVLSRGETLNTADIAKSVAAVTTTKVMNTIGNFKGLTIFGNTPAGCVTAASITLSRDGAANEYGFGHADSCGAQFGSFMAAGSVTFYFKSSDEYQAALNETSGPITLTIQDDDGYGYTFTFLNAKLRNPNVNVSGKNKTITATFDIEANSTSDLKMFSVLPLQPSATPKSLSVGGNGVTVNGKQVTA